MFASRRSALPALTPGNSQAQFLGITPRVSAIARSGIVKDNIRREGFARLPIGGAIVARNISKNRYLQASVKICGSGFSCFFVCPFGWGEKTTKPEPAGLLTDVQIALL